MIGLTGLMLLHARGRSGDAVSPIEILFGMPQSASGERIEIRQGDVTVYMLPDATNRAGTISIVAIEPNPLTAADGWARPTKVNIEFRGPDGTPVPDVRFFHPLEICFKLTEEQWQSLTRDSRLFQVQTYADEKNPPRWEVLPYTLYADRLQLCGKTYHLSVFGLATRAVDPLTGATVTSMPGAVTGRMAALPVQTQERRRRDDPSQDAAPLIPTNPPAEPQPPAGPVTEEKQKDKEKEKDKEEDKGKEKDKGKQKDRPQVSGPSE